MRGRSFLPLGRPRFGTPQDLPVERFAPRYQRGLSGALMAMRPRSSTRFSRHRRLRGSIDDCGANHPPRGVNTAQRPPERLLDPVRRRLPADAAGLVWALNVLIAISRTEDVTVGQPCFAGTPVPVETLVASIRSGSLDQFLAD